MSTLQQLDEPTQLSNIRKYLQSVKYLSNSTESTNSNMNLNEISKKLIELNIYKTISNDKTTRSVNRVETNNYEINRIKFSNHTAGS
ncbi:MAG: hypothetical protein OEZ01_00915 [Candidatus Heimdallarchaeota archaeon]|nr:hypothetical protein [Candidatus Heimdallarchaeota archaeon]MDH5644534.1 hypothetical protein [Candidatus Heimdallarchaeota archaeon]